MKNLHINAWYANLYIFLYPKRPLEINSTLFWFYLIVGLFTKPLIYLFCLPINITTFVINWINKNNKNYKKFDYTYNIGHGLLFNILVPVIGNGIGFMLYILSTKGFWYLWYVDIQTVYGLFTAVCIYFTSYLFLIGSLFILALYMMQFFIQYFENNEFKLFKIFDKEKLFPANITWSLKANQSKKKPNKNLL